jgi:hypothetical protein
MPWKSTINFLALFSSFPLTTRATRNTKGIVQNVSEYLPHNFVPMNFFHLQTISKSNNNASNFITEYVPIVLLFCFCETSNFFFIGARVERERGKDHIVDCLIKENGTSTPSKKQKERVREREREGEWRVDRTGEQHFLEVREKGD